MGPRVEIRNRAFLPLQISRFTPKSDSKFGFNWVAPRPHFVVGALKHGC